MHKLKSYHKGFFIVFLLFLLSLILSTKIYSETNRQVIKVGSGRVTFNSMIRDISDGKVIYIGESHDNRLHHETQLDIIKTFYENGYPLAIGLEMFMNKDQNILDKWITKEIKEDDFIEAFYRNWGIGWGLYKDIFLYAREKGIPMIGLNVPREITRKVAEKGFQSLSREDRAKLPPNITCDIDKRYMDLLQRLFEIKARNSRTFKNFCEAQVLWDQAMAWYINQYLDENPKRKVIVLTGNIHAWKYGIPRQLQRFVDINQKVVLSEIPADIRSVSKDEADYIIIHR